MPEIIVYAVEGRTAEQKKSLMKDITDAVVNNFQVPLETVTVQIVELKKDSRRKAGCPLPNGEPASRRRRGAMWRRRRTPRADTRDFGSGDNAP